MHQSWFFLPRKASHEAYDDKIDEQKATNMLIKCSEDFTRFDVTHIGKRWVRFVRLGYCFYFQFIGIFILLMVSLSLEK